MELNSVSADEDDLFNREYSLDDAIEDIGYGIFQIKLIIAVGISWMADSMEMMVLSILSPVLMCEWSLSSYKEAMITTVVFLGQGIGSVMWGSLSDIFGRKRVLCGSVSIVLLFGILSSLAPSYVWILVCRLFVGFGIGGVPQAAVILTEVLPVKHRGRSVIFLAIFWAFGSVFAAAIALAIIDWSWRYYLLIISSPLLLFLIAAFWIPESPRYLLTSGQTDKVETLLLRIADSNNKSLPKGSLQNEANVKKRGRVIDLFTKEWRITIALLFTIWFTSAFCYYGIVLLTAEIFQTNINGCNPTTYINSTRTLGQCKRLTPRDYKDFLWTSIAEFPGLLVPIFLIDRIGRRRSLSMQFGFALMAFLLLGICTTRPAYVAFIFIARAFISGCFMTTYVYTAEVFPTSLRAVAMGTCSMFARLGALLTPFVAQVLIHQSFYIVIGAYAASLLACLFASLLLRIETCGKTLDDSSSSAADEICGNYQTFH